MGSGGGGHEADGLSEKAVGHNPLGLRAACSAQKPSLDAGALAESLGQDAAGALGSGCLG